MKRLPLKPDEYIYAMDDDRTMHRWTAKQVQMSTPKGRRKAGSTNRAKALLKKLGL